MISDMVEKRIDRKAMEEKKKMWSICVLIAILSGVGVSFGSIYLNLPQRSVEDVLDERLDMLEKCQGGELEIRKVDDSVSGRSDLAVYCVFSK